MHSGRIVACHLVLLMATASPSIWAAEHIRVRRVVVRLMILLQRLQCVRMAR